MRRNTLIIILLTLLLGVFNLSVQAATDNFPEVMIILDGSGSMWGQAGGESKIAVAKNVLKELVPSMSKEVRIGLTVYGHREKGRCDDIEIIVPAGSDDRELLLEKLEGIQPKGKTPIADSIKRIVDELKGKENETTIILVSDGEETCHPDPCAVVRELKKTGIKFILHVVGFDVNHMQQDQLSCLAEAGGGTYFGAANATDLLSAFQSMQQEVVKKVEFEKAATTKKKTVSKIGKLRVIFPKSGKKSLAHIRIVRKSDNKTIKIAADPDADSTHPLLAGEYDVVFGYANTNYQNPSEIGPNAIIVIGGQTTELQLGALVFNVAESLKKLPAASVTLSSSDGKFILSTPGKDNNYYFFTTKPLPPGAYFFEYHYKTMPAAAVFKKDIVIKANAETVLTVDSGIRIKKNDQKMTGFDVTDTASQEKVLQVRRRWDNTYPLWEAFPIAPGTYEVHVRLKGMDEPLPVGEITIENGQLLEFDTGL